MSRTEAERIADMLARTEATAKVVWGIVGLLAELNGALDSDALRGRAMAPPPGYSEEDW